MIVETNLETMDYIALNDWFERQLGFRPCSDLPAMTLAEMLALCLAVAFD